jgi:hypothetical protein
MTRARRLTARIRGVIEAAGCASTTFADGSEEISDDGGEIRYVVREREGRFSVTKVERGVATGIGSDLHGDDALRLLVSLLGPHVRMLRGLPWFVFPVTTAELPPGYSIQSAEAGDVLFHSGTAVGTFAHGDSAYSDAARFAHLHGLDLAELERLFTSANDRP